MLTRYLTSSRVRIRVSVYLSHAWKFVPNSGLRKFRHGKSILLSTTSSTVELVDDTTVAWPMLHTHHAHSLLHISRPKCSSSITLLWICLHAVVQQLTRFRLTWRVARSLGDSWTSRFYLAVFWTCVLWQDCMRCWSIKSMKARLVLGYNRRVFSHTNTVEDSDIWRTVCDTGLRSFLNGWITTSEERRAARHTASTKPKTGPRCPQCSRVCASDFGLRSRMRSHDKTGNT